MVAWAGNQVELSLKIKSDRREKWGTRTRLGITSQVESSTRNRKGAILSCVQRPQGGRYHEVEESQSREEGSTKVKENGGECMGEKMDCSPWDLWKASRVAWFLLFR